MAGGLLRLQLDVPGDLDSLDLILDQERTTKAEDQALLAQINEYLGLSDEALIPLGMTRDVLVDQSDTLNARILSYGWPRHNVTLNVVEGDWLSPQEVVSFCGETGVNVADFAVDEDTGTIWRHTDIERHTLVVKLRDFPLRVEKIRFRFNNTDNERLTDLDVRMSKELANINDPDNLLEDDLNITWPGTSGVWVEHTLTTSKASAVYIKLEFDTVSGIGQIREFEVFCTPKKAG